MTRKDEIRERLDAASPEPWSDAGYDDHQGDEGWYVHNGREGAAEYAVAVVLPYNPRGEADARLIVHAPSDLGYLLAENERLRKALEAAVSAAEGYRTDLNRGGSWGNHGLINHAMRSQSLKAAIAALSGEDTP